MTKLKAQGSNLKLFVLRKSKIKYFPHEKYENN